MSLLQEAYGVIYEVTNLINNKTYIGQTIMKGNSFSKYFGSGKLIKRAFYKYGKSNFKKEILEYCFNRETLNDSEVFWISSLQPNYNLAAGGYINPMWSMSKEEKDKWRQKLRDVHTNRSEKEKETIINKIQYTINNRSEKEKEIIKQKLYDVHTNRSEEEKEIIKQKKIVNWKNKPQEEKNLHNKKIKNKWANKSKEEKEITKQKIKVIINNRSQEKKILSSLKHRNTWKNKPQEEKNLHNKKLKDTLQNRTSEQVFITVQKMLKTKKEAAILNNKLIILEDITTKSKQIFYTISQASEKSGLSFYFFKSRLNKNIKLRAYTNKAFKDKIVRYATEEEKQIYINSYLLSLGENK